MLDLIPTFNEIRDIPYQIPLTSTDTDSCCTGKMKLLKKMADANGYPSRYRVCGFRWSDLRLPEKVISVSHQNDSTHVYLEVCINRTWVDVDPTWDSGLGHILPVNKWDGKSNCAIAVPVISKYSEQESKQIMDGSFDEQDIWINGKFYEAFNEYLKECRNERH